ncbi:hypothetical protein AXG93_2611s1030 [Marchantia polymorpha subsp. ruderalis]|uniref:Uncharacterized protein n=1 Tax=Marchantia polymorpha subsp. ruderalis TaxID=1480154 RepID=A0A176VJZ9_MARPO|nr:hypothetical protein AXG93_2611s1030 [Marchantia polymorpha subsp. ruderalis]
MARPIKLHALRVPEVGLRAYHCDLILIKMEFLLWGWNWTSDAITQEWNNNGLPKPPGYRGHPDTRKIWDWKKVLGRSAGDDGDLTFDAESVRVTREEERAYVDLFKHPRTGKNGYRIVWWGLSRGLCAENVFIGRGFFGLSPDNTLGYSLEDSQPRKKRRIDEATVEEVRVQRTALFAMQAPDSRARSKMKARRLILDNDSSPENRGTVRKECSNQEAQSVEKVAIVKMSRSGRSPVLRKTGRPLSRSRGLQGEIRGKPF